MRGVLRPRGVAVSMATLMAAASLSPAVASAAGENTLYVNSANSNCTNSGTGTYAAPYCTIQAAADVANPGDVVNVVSGTYSSTTITRSGTASAPIVFTGNGSWNGYGEIGGAEFAGLDVTGASYVDVENFVLLGNSSADAAVVSGGSEIAFNHDSFGTPRLSASVGLHVTGAASGVSVRDSHVMEGVLVDGGSTGTTLTTNYIYGLGNPGSAVVIAGASNSAITSNTIYGCEQTVSVTGSSTGTSIQNNVVTAGYGYVSGCTAPSYGVFVDSGSASSTTADYNDVYASTSGTTAYDWSGTPYSTASALYTAQKQGQHDDNSIAGTQLVEGSPLISSANSAAVGEQSLDISGNARVADPTVTPTGVGPYNYYDRGAAQFQDPVTAVKNTFTASASQAPVSGMVTVNAAYTDTWSDNFTYAFAFSGGAQVTSTTGTASLSVPSTPGAYTLYEYVTPSGSTSERYVNSVVISVVAAAPLVAGESFVATGARTAQGSDVGTTGSWNVTGVTYDFGDSTPKVSAAHGATVTHTYTKAGTYPITETVTDAGGNTASTTTSFTTNAPSAGTLMHAVQPSGGVWPATPWAVPAGSTGIVQAAITGLPNRSSLVAAVTTSGTLEYDVRSASGSWTGWTTLSQPGVTVDSVSVAGMPNGSVQFVEVTSTGTMMHDIRNADGTWQKGGWGTPVGSTGIVQAAITAMPNGYSQLVAVTSSGVLEFNIRFASSWQGWRALSQPGVKIVDASIAGMSDGSSQFAEVTSTGVLKHNIRFANGSWQIGGWGTPVGSTGISQVSVAALPNGSTVFVAVQSGGGYEFNVRNPHSWNGWSVFDPTYLGSIVSGSIAGLSDGSAQLVAVAGG